MNSAEQHARQVTYDRLHHLMRLEWLESLPNRDSLEHRLLQQSRQCLSDSSGMHGYNSVDVNDVEYLAELNEFARQREAA